MVVGLSSLPAAANHVPGEGSRDFVTTARAMFADPSQVTAADSIPGGAGPTDSDHLGIMTSPAGSFASFPTSGPDFGMISTGDTDKMNDPNAEENLSTTLSGQNTNAGQDLVGLSVTFNVPAGANCLNADVKMLSDEFPEFVGTQFNDFAAASMNNAATPTVSGTDPSLPGNFLFDGSTPPNELEINTSQLVSAANAGGTTYDGATPTLLTQTPVTPGASNTVRLWTGDLGDSIYDTTLFVDNIRIFPKDPCPTETKGPSVVQGLKTKVKGNKATISGQILPPAVGAKVVIILFANGSPLKKVGKKSDTLNSESRFSKRFAVPRESTRCKVKVKFAGDPGHFASAGQKRFRC
jgi:hypothetical protein